MDKVRVTVNTAEFVKALQDYVAESRLDVADAINKKAGDVAFFGNKRTKAAKKGDIPPYSSGLYNALVAAGPGAGSANFQKAVQVAQKRVGGRFVKGAGNKAAAQKVRNRRASAIYYCKAIWLSLAKQLGKQVKVKIAKGLGNKDGEIKNTHAKAAKRSKRDDKPFSTLTISGVEAGVSREILEPALQGAVDDAVKDMGKYLKRKFEERGGKKFTGRTPGRK